MTQPQNTNHLRDFADKLSAIDCEYLYAIAAEIDATRTARNLLAAENSILKAMNDRYREALEELRAGDFTSRGVQMIVQEALDLEGAK